MSDVRCLFSPDRQNFPRAHGAPKSTSKEGLVARNDIAEFLDAHLMQPLFFTSAQHQNRVEQSLDTMTQAERIYLEIEMYERARVMHSFDYDPVR